MYFFVAEPYFSGILHNWADLQKRANMDFNRSAPGGPPTTLRRRKLTQFIACWLVTRQNVAEIWESTWRTPVEREILGPLLQIQVAGRVWLSFLSWLWRGLQASVPDCSLWSGLRASFMSLTLGKTTFVKALLPACLTVLAQAWCQQGNFHFNQSVLAL